MPLRLAFAAALIAMPVLAAEPPEAPMPTAAASQSVADQIDAYLRSSPVLHVDDPARGLFAHHGQQEGRELAWLQRCEPLDERAVAKIAGDTRCDVHARSMDAARRWFAGRCSDADVISEVKARRLAKVRLQVIQADRRTRPGTVQERRPRHPKARKWGRVP